MFNSKSLNNLKHFIKKIIKNIKNKEMYLYKYTVYLKIYKF